MAKLPAPGGDARTYNGHSGIDFLRGASWFHKPFYASGPGTIRRLSHNAAGGNWVVVKYDGYSREVGYAHMDNHNGCPRPGTRVKLGTRLGYVGQTGTRVTGPHIHVEILGVGTDSAVWGYFDRNRTVQQAMAGGGGGKGWNRTKRSTKAIQKVVGAKQDGIHGKETDSKIRAFQKHHGLAVDGIWGAKSDAKGFPPKPKPKPKPSKGTLQGVRWTGVQRMLKSDFGYSGKIDNIPGTGTVSAFQRFMNAKGYARRAIGRNLKVDGKDGNNTLKAAQQWLKERWGYKGRIDAKRGAGTNGAWARAEAANGRAYS